MAHDRHPTARVDADTVGRRPADPATYPPARGDRPTRGRYFGVRVTIVDDTGNTHIRDYVRGDMRITNDAFESFALGDLIRLVDVSVSTWDITPITKDEIR